MSRLRPICGCMCETQLISCARKSLNCAAHTMSVRNRPPMLPCPLTPICRGRNRCWAGHWLLAYVEMFLRDADRLADCRKRLNVCPLGSGAVAGATLALDRALMADSLDFDGATANSIDATSDRDFAIEFVNSLSLLALHLSRWAEEMILFSSQEYSFLVLPEAYSTGSSAMPQKKNPDLLELVRGKSGRVPGPCRCVDDRSQGIAAGLQQGFAGNARAAVRLLRHPACKCYRWSWDG